MASAAVTSSDLTYEYAPGVGAVGLDLHVPTGTVYGFLGPNGAGKSTAIRMLTSLIKPQRGSVSVLGMDPWSDGPALHHRLGVLASDQPAPRHHTGGSLLALIAKLRERPEVIRHGHELAERLQLNLAKKGHELSLGNRQKLGLVTALVHEPDLVILDEPTNGLDPLLQREIGLVLRELADSGRTVMLSSHSLHDVEAVADHVGFIRDAVLVEQLPLDALAQRAVRRVRFRFGALTVPASSFDGVPNIERVDVADDGEVIVQYRGAVAALLTRAGELGAQTIEAHPVELEETFLALYRGEGHVNEETAMAPREVD
jgi:ABC-2 type transport system ATP-binding protein